MKNYLVRACYRLDKILAILVISLSILASCTDDYYYDDKEPEWLGTNIYDELKSRGNFTNYVKLIEDLNYKDVLQLTGSKTLFVANDSSFNEFYKSNPWKVAKYEDMTLSQKKLLFNFSMINNAYVLKMLANYYDGTLHEGTAMRRLTALSPLDSIPFEMGDQLPTSSYWDGFRFKGMHVLKDNTSIPLVYFTQEFLDKYSITNDDFKALTGVSRKDNDVHVFANRVQNRDVVCKNGFVNVVDRVDVPPFNMAQYIASNSDTKIFSKLLDRFCAPYYDATNTNLYKLLHPEFTDSIYTKSYFSSQGGKVYLPDTKHNLSGITSKNLLPFDPGWNAFSASGAAIQADMAAMFVPNDDAMNNYFNSKVGEILKSRFGTWENIPDEIVLPFVKRHMRTSLIESVPSKFDRMVDGENYPLPVKKDHILKSYMGVNGEVFTTNNVYPPVAYISVYSPVLLSGNSKVMNWAINISELSYDKVPFAFYQLYLNSLVSKYSLFIPTDEYLHNFIDPIAYSQDVQGVLKYWYNSKTNVVNATVYKYSKATGIVGDSVDVITNQEFLKNRLWDILSNHIVVGDVESGQKYYITKGNDIIKVEGSGTNLTVQGGQDILNSTVCKTTNLFNQANGNTYFLDKPIEPALKSVYTTLSEKPEFSEFYDLLSGVPDTCINQIFAKQGVDFRIKFFNAYRYTVYVPTNEAVKNAIDSKLITPWATIYTMEPKTRSAAIQKMIRFLKYHFQDNAVFYGQTVNDQFQSATIKTDATPTHFGTSKNKYFKLGVVGSANELTLTMDSKAGEPVRMAKVVTENGLYNIIAKDYIFNKLPSLYKNIDGTGVSTAGAFNTSSISTSASAIIHQIDNVLTIE